MTKFSVRSILMDSIFKAEASFIFSFLCYKVHFFVAFITKVFSPFFYVFLQLRFNYLQASTSSVKFFFINFYKKVSILDISREKKQSSIIVMATCFQVGG
jgi:hypothetical protein